MSNVSAVLNEAADLLENGWCTGQFATRDGKVCAGGALYAAGNNLTQEQVYLTSSNFVFDYLDESDAVVALAREIRQDPTLNKGFMLFEVVAGFNDNQENAEPVIELLRKVAKYHR